MSEYNDNNIQISSDEQKPIDTNSDGAGIGRRIFSLRQDKKLSQRKLAALIGVSSVYMCKIESGAAIPSRDLLKKLSAYLGVPYASLLATAGYNNVSGDFHLYRKMGDTIDTKNVLESIYKSDTELLDYFMDFDEIGSPENIQVLKTMLLAMRKEVSINRLEKSKVTLAEKLFRESFFSLKNFIISLLTPMIENRID